MGSRPHSLRLLSHRHSLYSLARLAYPSLLSPAHTIRERGRQAGWIDALAGWIGSALGIGMGQTLDMFRRPSSSASAVILAPVLFRLFLHRPRQLALSGVGSSLLSSSYRIHPPLP